MIDEAQKLRRFKDAVYTEAEGKVNKIISDARQDKSARLKMAEADVRSRTAAEIQRIDKEESQRLTKESSAARLEAQRRVLLHRSGLSDKVFESVKRKLADFRSGGGYAGWLESAVNAAKRRYPGESAEIDLALCDEKYAGALKKASGFEVRLSPSILLGGVSIRFDEINVVLDCTFDSAVEEERESFCRTAGLAVGQE